MTINNILNVPSPNYHKTRGGYKPVAIVIHIMEGTLAGTDSWFKSPLSDVSAHYGIGFNGEIHQYVDEKDTAWHAGRVHEPCWKLIKTNGPDQYVNPNLYTIGIEHEGDENKEWTEATYHSSSMLLRQISIRWQILLDRNHVIGHHEIYSLKACPGNKVNLERLINMAVKI